MENKYEALRKLCQSPETASKLLSLSPDEAVNMLKTEYQLDFTVDELNDVASGINDALADDTADELSTDQLDEVAGGGRGSAAYNAGYYIGKTVKVVKTAAGIVGFCVAIGVISW